MKTPSARGGVWQKPLRFKDARRGEPPRAYSLEGPVEMSFQRQRKPTLGNNWLPSSVSASVLSSSCSALTLGGPRNLIPFRFCLLSHSVKRGFGFSRRQLRDRCLRPAEATPQGRPGQGWGADSPKPWWEDRGPGAPWRAYSEGGGADHAPSLNPLGGLREVIHPRSLDRTWPWSCHPLYHFLRGSQLTLLTTTKTLPKETLSI